MVPQKMLTLVYYYEIKNAPVILEKTVTKVDGHNLMGLLWRDEFPNLPNNRSLALSHFLSLEKKFQNNPEFHKQYQETVKEHIEKRHATKVKEENNTKTL